MGEQRRSWGSLRTQRSGRIQASYICPLDGERYNAPYTFDAKIDAEGWLADEKRLIDQDAWTPPQERLRKAAASSLTLKEYTETWIVERELADSTRDLHRTRLRVNIYPLLADQAIAGITPALVRTWWAAQNKDYPVARRQAYSLLHSIMNTAVEDKLLAENPCRIEQKAPEERDVEAITPDELDIVAGEVNEHYRVCTYVLAWSSLRFGEVIEVRRKDVIDDGEVMKFRVKRGATRVGKKIVVGNTKTVRSKRPVTIPPHVAVMVREHMRTRMGKGPEALLFTTTRGQRLSKSAFTRGVKKGYAKIGRPELRVHDLRSVGATYAAYAGATVKELMHRLGHTTPRMAMKYQMASEARDESVAEAMSRLVTKDS